MNATRRLLLVVAVVFAANVAIFGLYRGVFLWRFGVEASPQEVARVLGAGLRLDAALLGFEFSLTCLLLLLGRRLRPQRLVMWLWCLLTLHLFVCVANLAAFAERGQNSGELILPYATSPYQVYLAVIPFCAEHWGLLLVGIAGAVSWLVLGWRLSRKIDAQPIDLWQDRAAAMLIVSLMILPLLFTLTVVSRKKVRWLIGERGWSIKLMESKYFTHHREYALNEALLNPLYEFVTVQIPAQLQRRSDYHLTEAQATGIWQRMSQRAPVDPDYPLLTEIQGPEDSPIKNVIIIQVEGLSQSVLELEYQERRVMPFLSELAHDGYYFSNTVQNANHTSGGVFSTLTSVPKATYEEVSHRFASFEMNGHYSSLAHVLGNTNYTHYFFEAFRQSWNDFMSFASRQGCEAQGYGDFKKRLELKNQLAEADRSLGIHDDFFFRECAEILFDCPTHFTAHLMTTTTHSPWITPDSFTPIFDREELNAFAYFDASLEAFCRQLQTRPTLWEETLIVVIGDHTSLTFGNDPLERRRIPLVFYNPTWRQQDLPASPWASQVDVIPTVLGLLSGKHRYGGMGRNLLDRAAPALGIVGGTTEMGYYLKNGYLLEYLPAHEAFKLFTLTQGTVGADEVSEQQPEIVRQLREEYFTQVELAKRLAIARRIYPQALDGRQTPSQSVTGH
jgi:phosphoglycerol transferase MdoB-like AlkP superfamily enzyme